MMSILQNQAKQLEKELKKVRLSLVCANSERDAMADKLTITEEELSLIKQQEVGELVSEEDGEEEEFESRITQDELTELKAQMDALSIKLFQAKGELSRKDLQNAILEMQKCTSNANVESQKLKLGGLQTALDEARHELSEYRKNKSLFEEKNTLVSGMEGDLKRRDEQIEFYQEVVAASNKYDWVNETNHNNNPNANGSTESNTIPTTAPSELFPSGSSINAVRSTHMIDPLTQLENMGFDVGLAVQALESCGGNVDSAVLILTSNT
ncbi:hypothetical protein TrLO_g12171 [Triparma laevis f. longispina]|uniref:UBA domain-containing protein n=1 Tax=Triparma laevis f. longispina TaxID=1714387 RepID=A0A9W7C776_9STRA|nr:hypothetical protein TrLO_g12171 [Triparma laevis f. longispina]